MGFEEDYENYHHACEGIDEFISELTYECKNKILEIKNSTKDQKEIEQVTDFYKRKIQAQLDIKEQMRKKVFKN